MTTYQYKVKTGGNYITPDGHDTIFGQTDVFTSPEVKYEHAAFEKYVNGIAEGTISAGTPGATTATVTFKSAVSSSAAIKFGTVTGVYTSQVTTLTPTLSQSLGLTGLITATQYFYKVGVSADGGYTWTWSPETSLTTA